MGMGHRRVSDYGLIGDCETAALVGKDGSIDWLCLPRFDGPACFARLLGDESHGFWRIAPEGRIRSVRRRYVGDTLVLETSFSTEEGDVAVTDFMPFRADTADLVRMVRVTSGAATIACDIDLRFDYGRIQPWIEDWRDGFCAIAGPDGVICRSTVHFSKQGLTRHARFKLSAGESVSFVLSHFPSHRDPPPPLDAEDALEQTLRRWRTWAQRCAYEGPHRDAVVRSLIVLKALTHRPTGGVIAAPTTSLPEVSNGKRNWDYRFCWLRDATFLLLTLLQAGYVEEARAWRQWLVRAAAGDPAKLQPLYGVAGEPHLVEWVADWLPGFNGAAPVRIGNGAHRQFQLDGFGEILDVLHQARESDIAYSEDSWRLQRDLADYLVRIWTKPDAGIWESRAAPRHFTHSKVMAWVGLDRCVRAAERYGLDGDYAKWREAAANIRAEVFARGFSTRLGAFNREYDVDELDASALMFAQVGFVEPDDPRMLGTVRAIERGLIQNGFVRRYDPEVSNDGVEAGEGMFLPCSCWLADAYALQGRMADAQAIFWRLLSVRNDLGLLSEEYDPVANELIGNFPQALTHVGLIDTAFNLAQAEGPAQRRREHASGDAE
jgi:GH15 family glucan-1,4-alpha-glucosidase